MESGRVKLYNKDKAFGFIIKDSGGDIFFHKNQVKANRDLKEGDEVSFDIGDGKKGPCAENIVLL